MSHDKGILISFEGSEGCGKSTQIRRIADRLEDIDHREVVVTREPGGTLIGEDIRHLLMHKEEGEAMFPETELLLFAASRAQLVREVIFPAVEEGKIVLCDRFLDSTTVYQGVARQIAEDPVTQINNFAVGEIIPDLTVILDIPPELGMGESSTPGVRYARSNGARKHRVLRQGARRLPPLGSIPPRTLLRNRRRTRTR